MSARTLATIPRAAVMLSAIAVAWASWTPARAGHVDLEPETAIRNQVEQVRKLAHRVEQRARRLHRAAARAAPAAERLTHDRLTLREERALTSLYELEDRARSFHRRVSRPDRPPAHGQLDFRELQIAYGRAASAILDFEASRKVDLEFGWLSDAMYELEIYAAGLFVKPARGT